MYNLRKYLFLFFFVGLLTASASAQVRFNVYSNPYSGPGLSVSVGNGGYYRQPVYNTGYVVYPANNGYRHRRHRAVVVAPVYTGGYYNSGYYPNGNCNSGYYVNNGYNQGYNPGYGYGYGYASQGYYPRRCR
jgi:hypothetical protein